MESDLSGSITVNMESRVAQFIDRTGIPIAPCTVIVGLSGGADSVALLAILTRLGYKCIAAHCNFHLRGEESERDMNHARSIAARLGAQFECIGFDTRAEMAARGISLEMAARELRYDWFRHLSSTYGDAPVAVAHHRDDNIETMMLNLLRGTGIHGMRGMLPVAGLIIRPLLCCSRAMIEEYINAAGLEYITDSSNAVNDVARNRLRNVVLPTLYAQFPDAAEAILRSMGVMADNERLINATAGKAQSAYMHNGTLRLAQLIADWGSASHAMLYELLAPFGFNSTNIHDLMAASAHPGARIESRTHVAEVGRDTVTLSAIDASEAQPPTPPGIRLQIISPQEFSPERNPDKVWFDASVLDSRHPLILRPWRHGDRIKPYGMNGSRLISDILTDAKINMDRKRNIWVLTHGDDILWIPGIRAARLFSVTTCTKKIVQLTVSDGYNDIAISSPDKRAHNEGI